MSSPSTLDPISRQSSFDANGFPDLPERNPEEFTRLALVGSGRYSEVYLARENCSNKLFVIKYVHIVSDSPSEGQCIDREVEAFSYLIQNPHPNIVQCYGWLFSDLNAGFILEYMNIGSLHRLIRLYGRGFDEKVVASMAKQILLALVALHEASKPIVHRDIKPGNILVSLDKRGCFLKLADFNTSRIMRKSLQYSDTGTETYMSPERIQSDGHGTPSDIWSFGLVVMHLALGRNPIYGHRKRMSRFEVLTALCMSPPPRLPEDQFSAELLDFTSKCVRKEPKERSTARDLLSHSFLRNAVDEVALGILIRSAIPIQTLSQSDGLEASFEFSSSDGCWGSNSSFNESSGSLAPDLGDVDADFLHTPGVLEHADEISPFTVDSAP